MSANVLALVGLLLSAESAQAGPWQQHQQPLENRWVAPRRQEIAAWVLPSLFGGPVAAEKVCGDVYRSGALSSEREQRSGCRVREKDVCCVCGPAQDFSDWLSLRNTQHHSSRAFLRAMI